jgi:hypothetical protein
MTVIKRPNVEIVYVNESNGWVILIDGNALLRPRTPSRANGFHRVSSRPEVFKTPEAAERHAIDRGLLPKPATVSGFGEMK